MRDTLDISSEWKCIVSVPHLIKHVNHSWCHIDPCHFNETSSFYELKLTQLYFCHVQICTLNVHINICFCMNFRHTHLCTNDSPYSYGFLSCTCLYEWLSNILCMGFRRVHVCTNDFPFILNSFLSCTCLYEWLSLSLWMGFHHAHFCTNDYPFLLNGFLSCTLLYEWLSIYLNGFLSCRCLYEWLSVSLCMGFCHAHFCTNDYQFLLNWFSSCTFLYEWLSISFELVFVMHIYVQMTINFYF